MSRAPTPLPTFSEQLTFGVEFEFGIRFEKQPFRENSDIWWLMKDTLIVETGLKILTEIEMSQDDDDTDRSEMSQDDDDDDPDTIPQSELFNTWIIGTDNSLSFKAELKADKDHEYYSSIEMRTPVFKFGPDAFKEIHRMLTALKKHFDVVVNYSCGLHVHVGKEKEGISFMPLQHLMATIYTFEPQVSSLLHNSRINQTFCTALREESNLALRGYEGKLLDVMLGTSEVNEVVDMFGSWDIPSMAYQIDLLHQPYAHPVKRTIEFRQHEGSMDSETVLNWVCFVVELVSWAHKISRQDLKIFLSKYVDSPESSYSVEDLFKEIGFPESFVKFYQLKISRLREIEKKEAEEREARLGNLDDDSVRSGDDAVQYFM